MRGHGHAVGFGQGKQFARAIEFEVGVQRSACRRAVLARGILGGLHDIALGNRRIPEREIVADAAGKKLGILGYKANLRAQFFHICFCNINAIIFFGN